MIDNDNELLAHALTYARQGWRVFPLHGADDGKCSCKKVDCGSKGKHPRIMQWQMNATTAEGEIRQWWATWPSANIGVATGAGSGVFVIDVDGPTGRSTLERWQQERGWHPETLTAITGRGSHLYFRHEGLRVPNNASKLGKGIDVRGDGGYVVAPPSMHASGHRYAWKDPGWPVVDAPDWLINAILGGEPVTGAGVAAEETAEDMIGEGTRNDTLFSLGCGLRGKGFEVDEITEELMDLNDKRCSPPLLDSEVRLIAESAAKYEPNPLVLAPTSKDSPLWWFQLNVNDWCCDQNIMFMKDYQVGWYIWLKVEAWKKGGLIESAPAMLFKYARAKSKKQFIREMDVVLHEFEPTPDGAYLVNMRMADKWEDARAKTEKKRKAGRASAKARGPVETEAA